MKVSAIMESIEARNGRIVGVKGLDPVTRNALPFARRIFTYTWNSKETTLLVSLSSFYPYNPVGALEMICDHLDRKGYRKGFGKRLRDLHETAYRVRKAERRGLDFEYLRVVLDESA